MFKIDQDKELIHNIRRLSNEYAEKAILTEIIAHHSGRFDYAQEKSKNYNLLCSFLKYCFEHNILEFKQPQIKPKKIIL